MKISPITNYGQNSINCKGNVHPETVKQLERLTGSIVEQIKLTDMNDQITRNFMIGCIKRSRYILTNLGIIMQRLGKSCSLELKKSEKSDLHRFFITSPNSNYKHICGDVHLDESSPKSSLFNLEEFVDKFSKINPYEINFRFKISRKDKYMDSFAPEQDYDFIEDKLLKLQPAKKQASWDDIKKFLNQAKEEGLL